MQKSHNFLLSLSFLFWVTAPPFLNPPAEEFSETLLFVEPLFSSTVMLVLSSSAANAAGKVAGDFFVPLK
jgi:hypothetical protein